MNGAKAVRKYAVSEAVARGTCPICTMLRHRQTHLIEVRGIPNAVHLCNHHAWSLARSAPAAVASEVFLQSLYARQRDEMQNEAGKCDFCEVLRQEETAQLNELVEKMKTPVFLEWMRRNGTLCLRHASKVGERLPNDARPAVAELLSRTLTELEQDLEEYSKVARQGAHAGGGVLGRAAEFLVCQRGIPGEETPC
jgi:hypothetical protein